MAEKKEAPKKLVNPFEKVVSYADLLKACGSKSVRTYLKDVCSEEQLTWLEKEIEHYKNHKKK